MRFAERDALLADVLDRQVKHLTQGFSLSDWTLFWHVDHFTDFLLAEPTLSAFLDEYREEAEALSTMFIEGMRKALNVAFVLIRKQVGDDPNFADLVRTLKEAAIEARDTQKGEFALGAACGSADHGAPFPLSADGSSKGRDRLHLLRERHRALAADFERHAAGHPGVAFWRLICAVEDSRYTFQGSPESRRAQNERAAKLQAYMRESDLWTDQGDRTAQPGVARLHRNIKIVHLALVTSLALGRSRFSVVERFAARCVSFDRDRLNAALKRAPRKAEAFLTMEFAKYLFDAGLNPLVDPKVSGLRPDVLDVREGTVFYVEVKQYQRIGKGIDKKLESGLAQTLSTWGRLANRWHVPEAYLLVFRRSGHPLELENADLRTSLGLLRVLYVDLGGPEESGSRAKPPIRVDLKALLAASQEDARR